MSTAAPRPRQPVLGDRVHYILDAGHNAGQCRAADIVRLWTPGGPSTGVNLHVLTDCANDFAEGSPGAAGSYWATSITQRPDGAPRSYHYAKDCTQPNQHPPKPKTGPRPK